VRMNTTEGFQEQPAVFPNRSGQGLSISSLADQPTPTENLSLQVATSLQAVEDLKPIWKRWSHNLDTDHDYYLHNLKSDSTILSPYVVTVYQGQTAQAMLVGQVRKQRMSTVVSFVNIRGPKVKVLEIVNGGRMGEQSAAIDRLLALHLCSATRTADVDVLCFRRLPLQSELFRTLQQAPGLLMKERVPHVFHYSVVPLTASSGKRARALSGKNRREVRRKTRILQRNFPGKTLFQCFSQPEELEAGLREAASVDVTTWQHYLGCGLVDARRSHDSLSFCSTQGWLRIYVMYVDRLPVAFLIGQQYQETFYCQHAGYHPDFSRFSVGSLLTAWVLETLADAGVKKVDLGEGSQEHNRRLGCSIHEEGTVHVYSPTLRGLYLNMLFAATQAIRTIGRGSITKLHLNRASKAWSQFLISRWKARKLVGDPCS
jgi:GNAT acetyltransferase-like protein